MHTNYKYMCIHYWIMIETKGLVNVRQQGMISSSRQCRVQMWAIKALLLHYNSSAILNGGCVTLTRGDRTILRMCLLWDGNCWIKWALGDTTFSFLWLTSVWYALYHIVNVFIRATLASSSNSRSFEAFMLKETNMYAKNITYSFLNKYFSFYCRWGSSEICFL